MSVAQLRHRIPKAAKQAYHHASDLSQQGDTKGSLKELERAVELDPDWAEARNDLGLQYVWRAQYLEAEIEFQRTVDLAPQSSVAHLNLALVELQLGKREAAEQHLRQAVQIAPGDLKARVLLDRLLR